MAHLTRCFIAVALSTALATIAAPVEPAIAQTEPASWLALGDSFSSGEGISGTERPAAGQQECARATGTNGGATAYAVSAFNQLRDELSLNNQQFVACTGATNDDVIDQISEARSLGGSSSIDWRIATLTTGGNNLGFASIIHQCLDIDRPWGRLVSPGCDVTEDELMRRVDALSGITSFEGQGLTGEVSLPEVYRQVADVMAPGGTVFVLGYPQLFEDPDRWSTWRRIVAFGAGDDVQCEGIYVDDANMLRSVQTYFNAAIQNAVRVADSQYSGSRNVRFVYVDLAEGLYESESNGRHGLCSGESWFNGVTIGLTSGDFRTARSFHPNSQGHSATADYLGSQIRQLPDIVGRGDATSASVVGSWVAACEQGAISLDFQPDQTFLAIHSIVTSSNPNSVSGTFSYSNEQAWLAQQNAFAVEGAQYLSIENEFGVSGVLPYVLSPDGEILEILPSLLVGGNSVPLECGFFERS